MLRSYAPDLGNVAAPFAFGGNDSSNVLELRAAERLTPSPPVPETLTDRATLDEEDASVTRHFALSGREINGARMDMDRIDEVIQLGSTEIWTVKATDLNPHNFHIHDVQFQVLDIDGEGPPPELAGLRDTIYLERYRTYRLIMRFEDHADPDTPFMYHCHLLLHEDEGLMGQFLVTEEPPANPTESHPDTHNPASHSHSPKRRARTTTQADAHTLSTPGQRPALGNAARPPTAAS